MFKMGSTVAMVFEVPRDYGVVRETGQKVKLGEVLVEG